MSQNLRDQIIRHVLDSEGGYVNDPDDPGGETNYGISKRSYPDVDIAALTEAHAIAIYRRDYWDAGRCEELPPTVAAFLFDALVQHRPGAAKKLLQHALNVEADGIIGPATIRAAHEASGNSLIPDLFARRLDMYADIAVGSRAKFRLGWFRRMCRLQRFIYTNAIFRGEFYQ